MIDAPSGAEAPSFRKVPCNLEVEQALLGAILVNNEAYDRVASFLDAYHFFDPLHGRIYETAAKLIAAGKQATPTALKEFFENAKPLTEDLTVVGFLGQLAANATTSSMCATTAAPSTNLSIRRQLITIGEDMVNSAYDSPVDFPPKEQIAEAQERLSAIAETGNSTGRQGSTMSNEVYL